ncbi:MAG: hypothetical protein IPL40_14800 [Proteobacteria bacterium]|nr:hypothetical protein [Pseudomonadota bacterium]
MSRRQRSAPQRWTRQLALLALLTAARPATAYESASDTWRDALATRCSELATVVGHRSGALTLAQFEAVTNAFPALLLRLGVAFPSALAAEVKARANLLELHRAALGVLERQDQYTPAPALPAGVIAARFTQPEGYRSAVAQRVGSGAAGKPPLPAGLTLDWHTPAANGRLPRPHPPRAVDDALVLRSPHDNTDVLWMLPPAALHALQREPWRLAQISDRELRLLLVPYWRGELEEARLFVWGGIAHGPLVVWAGLSTAPAQRSNADEGRSGRLSGPVALTEPAYLRLSARVSAADGSRPERRVSATWRLGLDARDGEPRLQGQSMTATRLPPPTRSVAPVRPSADALRWALSGSLAGAARSTHTPRSAAAEGSAHGAPSVAGSGQPWSCRGASCRR